MVDSDTELTSRGNESGALYAHMWCTPGLELAQIAAHACIEPPWTYLDHPEAERKSAYPGTDLAVNYLFLRYYTKHTSIHTSRNREEFLVTFA